MKWNFCKACNKDLIPCEYIALNMQVNKFLYFNTESDI